MEQNIPSQQSKQSGRVSDLEDLLIEIPTQLLVKVIDGKSCLSSTEVNSLKKINQSASNAMAPLLSGLAAMGEMLAQSSGEISEEAIIGTGWLLRSLSRQAEFLRELETHSLDLLYNNEALKNKLHKN